MELRWGQPSTFNNKHKYIPTLHMVCVCQKTYDGSKSDYRSVANLNGIKEFIIILMYNIINIIMSNIIDRQTFVFSISLFDFTTVGGVENRAEVQIPLNLRFAADELVVKSINYNATFRSSDVPDVVQIWCNITNDNIIGS